MQAVILAAGKSTRTYPLTLTRPKPLLCLANKPLIMHTLDKLRGIVTESIIVIGYRGDMIRKLLGSSYRSIRITYVHQEKMLGTAHALLSAKSRIRGPFLLLMGDDWYDRADLKKCSRFRYATVAKRVKDSRNFGVIVENRGIITQFVEKPKRPISNLANTALYCLQRDFFRYVERVKRSERGELELPDAINALITKEDMQCIVSKSWDPIGYPWDLLRVDHKVRKGRNLIDTSAKVSGAVKNSSIGKNCVIAGEVRDSIIMDHTVVEKGAVVESSVVGYGCTIRGTIRAGASTIIVKDKPFFLPKIGAIIGDRARIAGSIKPGSMYMPGYDNLHDR